MKKGKFAIYTRNEQGKTKIEMVSGYLLDYGWFRFGVRKYFTRWEVTELSTGTTIGIYANRKKDIIPVLENSTDKLDFIKKLLTNPPIHTKEMQEDIRKFYTLNPVE